MTLEWLFSSVYSQMLFGITRMSECLPAHVTLERLFARVNPFVNVSVLLARERLGTMLTGEAIWFEMIMKFVHFPAGGGFEVVITKVALKYRQ